MDDWFPIVRRGRSPWTTIRGPTPYDFADRLVYHNQIISHLEDNNSVYCGDTSPQFYVGIPPPPPPPPQLPAELRLLQSNIEMRSAILTTRNALIEPRRYRARTPISGPDDRELSPAPTERVSSPFTPNGNRPHAHLKTAARKKVLALRLAHPTPQRVARVVPVVGRGDNTDQGVFLQEPLSRAGNKIHSWIEKPRAIVDRKNVVMVSLPVLQKVKANGGMILTSGSSAPWSDFTAMSPHQIGNFPVNLREIIDIEVSEAFIVVNAYQNHIYQQAAPVSYATVEGHVNDLVRREIAFPAFKNSVFTTSEISFGDAGSPLRKNIQAAIGTFEAVTVVGTWDHEKGGDLVPGR
ncbi:hypothetical protein B0H13DRAFT_2368557 [Mycena leptocephala]|nr:hypothetical protein B0H13DRAFT_2368557 [Mycena leptocephala]